MDKVDPREILAGIVAVTSVLGLVVLSALKIAVPPELAAVVGAATTWLFVHSSIQSEHLHADSVVASLQAKKEE